MSAAMSIPSPLILVDGSSYLYRAFHAMPNLSNSSGMATGAIYGVLAMLQTLLRDYQPAEIAIVFDARGKTFRHDLYPDYKANRPSMPNELSQQIEPLHQAIRALGLPLLAIEGVEADDVIGTLACLAAARGRQVLISTGDKDMAQLVNEQISLINTMTQARLDSAGVCEKFGVPPERIVDYLTLTGDSSDNVPGVKGVGPKIAARWLGEFGDLDELMARAGEIKGKIGEQLRAALPQIPLSRTLVTIRCDLDLPLAMEDLRRQPIDRTTLIALYRQLEFKSWLADLLQESGDDTPAASEGAAAASPTISYSTITDPEQLRQWCDRLAAAPLFAIDSETTSLDPHQAELVGLSFAVAEGAAYLPLGHVALDRPTQLPLAEALEMLRPLLEDANRAKVGQHIKYDSHILHYYGIALGGIAHDTMLQSYLLDSSANRHDLDTLALKYLGRKTTSYSDITGKGSRQIGFAEVDIATASHYAAEDAEVTLALHHTLWPRLEAIPSLATLYREMEIPLIPVIARIERNGVLIDSDLLATQSHELGARLALIEAEAHQIAGESFNLNSPKQIQTILYERLGIPVTRKTPTGQPSTAEEVLQELAWDYPLPRLLLEHRSLAKLKSTYTDKLPAQVNQRSGRIHTSYHQAVAATGRLSSTDPNLQNIPVRTAEGRRIRQAFIAPEGYRLLAADYSQIELRIMAHLSQDEGLLHAFSRGEDIHRATAAEVFGVELASVSSDQRRAAKAINFGLIYGMSAFGLARQLGSDRTTAQRWIDRYFERYPGVLAYMDRTRQQARDQGYVETLFGRRLYIADIRASNAQRRQYAERSAINAPMQGSAADIIKRAMIAVDGWITRSHLDARIIMQVHDELVLEVAEGELARVKEGVCQWMAGVATLRVPLLVETGSGLNWDEAH
jgi:DNA polymerase I